jgi:cytochrome c oxidase subunit 2
MAQLLPFSPPNASTVADTVDRVFAIELTASILVVLLVAGLIIGFSIKYRRRSPDDSPPRIGTHYGLEAAWTLATFILFTSFFFLGAGVYVRLKKPPESAEKVYVVGKQWMWKIQHADGVKEINQLHVPVGRPIELVMTSEDVIHDFFVPAFRIKQDVIPGSYSSEWFTATQPGVYHVFCAQYCGTDHATMVGQVIVLTPADYQAWLNGVGTAADPLEDGRRVFKTYGCMSCHGQTAPTLAGLYMSRVKLTDGSTVVADDDYLRRSIVDPNSQIVAGYFPIMPSFRDQLTPEQLNSVVEYIKALSPAKSAATQPARPSDDGSLPHVLPDVPPSQGRPQATPPRIEVEPR